MLPRIAPFAVVALLSACGGSDPVPEGNDAASATQINQAVDAAQQDAVDAGLNATGLANDAQREEALAEDLITTDTATPDSNEQAPIGPATSPSIRATPVDPAAGDTLPDVPR